MSRETKDRQPEDEMSIKQMVESEMINLAVNKYRELCQATNVPMSRQKARMEIRRMVKEFKKEQDEQ